MWHLCAREPLTFVEEVSCGYALSGDIPVKIRQQTGTFLVRQLTSWAARGVLPHSSGTIQTIAAYATNTLGGVGLADTAAEADTLPRSRARVLDARREREIREVAARTTLMKMCDTLPRVGDQYAYVLSLDWEAAYADLSSADQDAFRRFLRVYLRQEMEFLRAAVRPMHQIVKAYAAEEVA
jgi:hypothetical protein